MSSKVPMFRQIAWFSVLAQLVLIALITFSLYWTGIEEPYFFAAALYFILAYLLRNLVAKDHRKGIQLVRQLKFDEAIAYFEQSVNYFTKHKWIDTLRFITLLSSSKMCYREMALCNIAFCYSQKGDADKVTEYYQKALNDYPQNLLAKTSMNMINAIKRQAQKTE